MTEIDPVARAWNDCRTARPDVTVTLEQFRAYLDSHRPVDVTLDDQLRTYCLADIYLVCGCIARDTAAIHAIEREVIPLVDAALATWDPTLVAETRQRLRVMLMVDHAGRGPLLAQFSGRGALRRWIRVVAAREAGKLRRTDRAETPTDDDALFDALAPASDPELSAIRHDAAVAFKSAFVASVAELERRDRTLLRLHLLDNLGIDEIAPMYAVHRATVARWIAAAKDSVLSTTRRRLQRELRLDAAEVDSLIRLVQSHIELQSDILATKT